MRPIFIRTANITVNVSIGNNRLYVSKSLQKIQHTCLDLQKRQLNFVTMLFHICQIFMLPLILKEIASADKKINEKVPSTPMQDVLQREKKGEIT